jgi:hypothetical protein
MKSVDRVFWPKKRERVKEKLLSNDCYDFFYGASRYPDTDSTYDDFFQKK